MTKKRENLFERIVQYYVSDKDDNINWWVNEEDMANFRISHKDFFDEDPDFVKETRTISGKEFNDWLIGNTFGDHEGSFIDKDCPECGHLLVVRDEDLPDEVFCSDCDYCSEEMIKADNDFDIELKQPEVKLRIPGDTLEEFKNRYGFSEGIEETVCIICKKVVPVSDFYRGRDMAVIDYKHEGCTNGGPSVCRPLGELEKKFLKLFN